MTANPSSASYPLAWSNTLLVEYSGKMAAVPLGSVACCAILSYGWPFTLRLDTATIFIQLVKPPGKPADRINLKILDACQSLNRSLLNKLGAPLFGKWFQSSLMACVHRQVSWSQVIIMTRPERSTDAVRRQSDCSKQQRLQQNQTWLHSR